MVCRACNKSSLSFGIVFCKYMGWYFNKDMNTERRVVCKVLTNKQLHTFHGMISYCLKDMGSEHFKIYMHNISDDDILEGKTLHAIFGHSDLK